MNIGLVIGLYDSRQQPFFVFSNVVPQEVAEKICQKALSVQKVLSGEPADNEGIFSLASNMVSVFIHFSWYIHSSINKLLPLVIAFTTPIHDQRILYKFFPQFSAIAKEIKDELIDLMKTTNKLEDFMKTAPHFIKEHYNIDVVLDKLRSQQPTDDDKNQSDTVFITGEDDNQHRVEKPISLLNETIPKNVDKIILPFITGAKAAIIIDADQFTGEENNPESVKLVNATIAVLQTFAPHRNIKVWKNYHAFPPKKSLSRYNVFILDDELHKKVKKENWVVIDLFKQKIYGGEENKFCVELFQEALDAEQKSPTHAKVVVRKKVDWLLFNASTFLEPDLEPEQVKRRVQDLQSHLDKDVMVIIARLVQRANPQVSDYIMKRLSLRKRLIGF